MIERSDLMNRAVTSTPRGIGPDEDAPRLTPAQLADYWGVSITTVYRDLRKGALPAFRRGRQFRIRPSDARRYGRPIE
jgi:excisionase family DNA binding protein